MFTAFKISEAKLRWCLVAAFAGATANLILNWRGLYEHWSRWLIGAPFMAAAVALLLVAWTKQIMHETRTNATDSGPSLVEVMFSYKGFDLRVLAVLLYTFGSIWLFGTGSNHSAAIFHGISVGLFVMMLLLITRSSMDEGYGRSY